MFPYAIPISCHKSLQSQSFRQQMQTVRMDPEFKGGIAWESMYPQYILQDARRAGFPTVRIFL